MLETDSRANMRTLAEANLIYENNAMTRDFFKACACLALARGRKGDALLIAQKTAAPARVVQLLQKAGAGVSDPGSGQWGLDSDLAQAFVQSLANNGRFDSALAFMRQMSRQVRLSVTVGRAIGEEVAAGALKPVSEITLDNATLAEKKVAAAVATTEELWRLATQGGRSLLEAELRSAIASATDALFISELSAALTPAGSTGELLGDLMRASEAIETGSESRLFAILSPSNLKRSALSAGTDGNPRFPSLDATRGGVVNGITIGPSDEIDDQHMLVFDAAQIAADGGAVDVSGTGEALLQMGGGADVSLFQRNMRGVRVERRFAFELLRSTGAALLDSLNYSQTS